MLHVRFGKIVFLVVILASVGQFANTIYVPALSMIAHNLHINPVRAQFLMTAYLLPYGCTQFIYGPLSDHYGRRPMVIIGLLIFLGGTILTVIASHFQHLLIGCVIQGTGAGVAGVMARTVMRDCYSDHKLYKANSIIAFTLIFAPLFAPVVGGLLSIHFGWRSDFIFLFILASSVLILEWYLFPETNLKRKKDSNATFNSFMKKYKQALKNRSFIGYMFCISLSFSGIAVFEAGASVLLTRALHFSPQLMTVLFIVPIPGYLVGSYCASYINRYLSIRAILKLALAVITFSVASLSIPAFAGILNSYVVLIPITFYMFGTGLLFPTAMTAAINPLGEIAGTAGALLGGVQNVCAALMTALFTLIPQTTQRPLAIMLIVCCVLMLLSYGTLCRHDQSVNKS
jgi:MFS transporter, DHA1 family, 2-module integral membrane pump EmrD